MSELDANTVEGLRYQLELFVDGSERSADFLLELARRLQETIPADDRVDAFLLSATVYGDPACATFRTEAEMRRECQELRRYLSSLSRY